MVDLSIKELGAVLGKNASSASSYKETFVETDELSDIGLYDIESIGLSGSYYVYTTDVNNAFVLDHPVLCNLDFDTDILATWSLEDTGSTITESVQGITTDAIGTSTVTGKMGNARQFASTADYLISSNIYSSGLNLGNSDFTFSCWIYPSTLNTQSNFGRIWMKEGGSPRRGWDLMWYTTGPKPVLECWNNGSHGPTTNDIIPNYTGWQANTWYHLVYTFNNSSKATAFYLNGSLNTSGTLGSALDTTNTNALYIGGNGSSGFKGRLDELSIWNRALSQQEVQDLYNNGTGKFYPTSIAHGVLLDGKYIGTSTVTTSSIIPEAINRTYTYTYSNAPDTNPVYADGSFTKLKNSDTVDPTASNESVGWHSTSAKYSSIAFASAVTSSKFVLYPGEQFSGTNPYVPKTYGIYYSDDAISYTLATSGSMFNTDHTVPVTFTSASHRYWRLNWDNAWSDWQMWREVEIYTSSISSSNTTSTVYVSNLGASTLSTSGVL